MGDETPTPDTTGTVETDANTPEGTGSNTAEHWQERYEHLQPEFTRATQDRDRYRTELEQTQNLLNALYDEDPGIRQQAAEALNLQLAEEIEDTPGPDLDPRVLARLEALEQREQSAQQAQAEEQAYAEYRRSTDSELAQMGVPKGLHDVVADTALGMARQTGENPDLRAALQQVEAMAATWAELPAVQNHVKKSWEQTKRAPHFSQNGVPGQGAPNLDEMSRNDRHAYMAQRLEELSE